MSLRYEVKSMTRREILAMAWCIEVDWPPAHHALLPLAAWQQIW